jgi:hypothetical protein
MKMPIKRKRALSRNVTISPAAIARWQEIRLEGIDLQGDCGILFDDALSDALGIPTLLWLHEAADVFHALEAAIKSEGNQAS